MSQQKVLAKIKKIAKEQGLKKVADDLNYTSPSTICRWIINKRIPRHALENARRYTNA